MQRPGCRIRRLGGIRGQEVRFHRFLRNDKVTVEAMASAVGARTGALCAGLDIAVIQDTSEIYAGGKALAAKGFGPIGKGGATRGVVAHVAIAVDIATGALLGLADLAVWTRGGGSAVAQRSRPYAEKESHCWLKTAQAAAERLKAARGLTMVSDMESDIYDYFALRPAGAELLVRARHDRALAGGACDDGTAAATVGALLDGLAAAERFSLELPAIPGRKARSARLALRFGPAQIKRPQGSAKSLAKSLALWIVEVREECPPQGVEPLCWRLITTHKVETAERAHEIVRLYRGRFQIEDLFRTTKSAGIDIEEADIEDPKAFTTFTALALIAASTILQLVKARGGGTGQTVEHAFEPQDLPLLQTLSRKLEGATEKQKNPHKPPDLAFASWVIARLGGWNCYYGKPGPKVMRYGLERFHAIKLGYQLAEEV